MAIVQVCVTHKEINTKRKFTVHIQIHRLDS